MALERAFRLRPTPLRPWQIAILAFGLILLMGWVIWDQTRLITGKQDEIQRLQERIRHLEERLGILNQIRSHRSTLPHDVATVMAHAIQREARRYDLGWHLLFAIIRVESGFDPQARSHRGAVGLMQVRPAALREVAKELGWEDRAPEELKDLHLNVRVGAHYLFALLRRFGDLEQAVQAYYLGPSRIANPSGRWKRRGQRYLAALGIIQTSAGNTGSPKVGHRAPAFREARWGGDTR
jgi:soluble lytic murein transglycosylase-like protein